MFAILNMRKAIIFRQRAISLNIGQNRSEINECCSRKSMFVCGFLFLFETGLPLVISTLGSSPISSLLE